MAERRPAIVPPDSLATIGVDEAVIYTFVGHQARRAAITPLALPDAVPERIGPDGPQHPIEMAVHPEQMIALPATVSASITDTGEEAPGEVDPGDDDLHAFEQL